jgi:hypothetical protein
MVKYMQIRKRVINSLKRLSDINYQERVWVRNDVSQGYEDCFDFVVNLFFDDTELADSPEKTIGIILKDHREVNAIRTVTQSIDSLLHKLGTDRLDKDYISDPDWSKVVEASKSALLILIDDANL